MNYSTPSVVSGAFQYSGKSGMVPGIKGALVALVAITAGICGPGARADEAADILEATGIRGGVIVHLGCKDGRLTAALRANDRYIVHGLESDAASVDNARAYLRAKGLAGAVSVETWTAKGLP